MSAFEPPITASTDDSPFHPGEQRIQQNLGVRQQMEKFGRQVIRDYMPQQHRDFYQNLPYIFVGYVDQQGWPWASMLCGNPGFIQTPDERKLTINTLPLTDDILAQELKPGSRVGLVGVELHTRRRNRLSATVEQLQHQMIRLNVDQAFGNCPQYIQGRRIEWLDSQQLTPDRESLNKLDDQAINLIEKTDTFFVSSYLAGDEARQGVDISHRGGKPGFIRVDNAAELTIPDYAGNYHFNTFGNFALNPKAGLLIPDFEQGDLLMLTGEAEVLWDSDETRFFAGAERLWKFRLHRGYRLSQVLPFRFIFEDYSPNTLITGSWPEAQAKQQSATLKEQWHQAQIERIEQESERVKSFYLRPLQHSVAPFKAGQYLTVKLLVNGKLKIRNYTVSSAPEDDWYRISVKREGSAKTAGEVSSALHRLEEGDIFDIRAPAGQFYFDTADKRPALLLAAGIGITPMISMLRHALNEGLRTRRMRNIVLIVSAKNKQQCSFVHELEQLQQAAGQQLAVYWVLSDTSGAIAGKDYQHGGRINRRLLQSVLALDNYQSFICGPSAFMQDMYDLLRSLGVNDDHIEAEAFGPASLQRDNKSDAEIGQPDNVAEQAIVEFSQSQVIQNWTPDTGTLLDFAEAHGLQPEFSCRSGRCGACKTMLLKGEVVHQGAEASIADDEVLLCCARPRSAPETGKLAEIKLAL